MRRIDDVLNSLSDSKYFYKLDVYKVYLYLRIDKETCKIQNMSTHKDTYGMYRFILLISHHENETSCL